MVSFRNIIWLVIFGGIAICLPGFGTLSAEAQNAVCDSVEVHFKVGKYTIDPAFGNNYCVDSLVSLLNDPRLEEITKIYISGSSSPEGSLKLNRYLSRKRAESVVKSIITPPSLIISLRTNLLYDAVTVPNLYAEFYLGKDWSISVGGMCAWWSIDSRHRYWRIYGGEIAMRRWLRRHSSASPLSGHHLGLYAGVFTFDFEKGGVGYMGGRPGGTILDRCLGYGGIEYGYSLPVARRFNIDFSIGVGYVGGRYIKYEPFHNFYQKTGEYHISFFGPTKAEISLVWLLGRGNINRKKGGGQ